MEIYSFSFEFLVIFLFVFATGLLFRPLHFRNIVLAIFFFFAAYLIGTIHIIETGIYVSLPHLLFTHFPFGLSLGPLIYFFVLSLTENKQSIKKWDWLHFIPAVISIVVLVPLLLQPAEMKIAIIKKFLAGQYASFRFLIVTILSSFIAYLVASTKKLWITIHKENPSHQKILLLLTTVFAWIVLVLLKAVFFLTLSFTLLKISNIMIMITILLVYFVMQRYPTFFLYGTISGSKKQKTKSYLGKIDTANLERELQALMQEEKFYCDEDITLKRLSAALEITPHQLSEFLNSHYNKNFNTYINTFRIKEGKELLLENERRNTLSIAYAVGFNSYTAFYTAFKQATGLSPADFRKKNSH